MTEKSYSVTLAQDVKIDGVIEPSGKTLTVTETLADQLSGVIVPGSKSEVSASGADNVDALIAAAVEQRLAEMRAEVEARIRDEIGDEVATLMAEKAQLVRLVRDLEDADVRAKTDFANLSESLTAEVNARVDLTDKLAAAEARASKAETALAALAASDGDGGASDQPEGGETPPVDGAANTQKAGKKPAAVKD